MPGSIDVVVNATIEKIVGTLELRRVLAHTAEGLGRGLGVSHCVVLVPPGDSEQGHPPVEWSDRPVRPGLNKAALTVARHLQRAAQSFGRPLAIVDAENHALLSSVRQELRALDVRSVFACTGEYEGAVRAVILLYQCAHARPWDENLVRGLSKVGRFLAVAVHHAELFGRVAYAEAQYRTLAQQSAAGIVHYDRSGGVVFVNQRFEELTGISAREVRGLTYDQLLEATVADVDRARVIESYAQAFRTAQRLSQRYRIANRQSGRSYWLLDQIVPLVPWGGVESSALDITDQQLSEEQFRRSEARYQRLVEHSDAVIFHASAEHLMTFASRRALDFFGIAPEDFVAEAGIRWFDLVHPDDYERVRLALRSRHAAPSPLDEEFRVINRVTGRVRWLLMRVVPVLNHEGALEGWDGFGIDISGRRDAQEALDTQSKKIRALYTVSSAIRGYLDPGNIASRGLAALCDATGASTGLCYVYPAHAQTLQLIAHIGFSPTFEKKQPLLGNIAGLAAYVARSGQSLVIPDLAHDPRSDASIVEEESVHSAVIVPIAAEEEILGAIGLFSRGVAQFDGGTVMLVGAAANQIGLAARQANLFSLYRRQTKNLSALYRISHELSQNLTVAELFQNAFTIIRDELGLRRLWLGLLNEAQTQVVGQAAYGPGWRRRLVGVNVEVSGQSHAIAKVIAAKTPLVLTDPREMAEQFGVKRLFARLAIHAIAIVPVMAGGQVLGVLVVQPGSGETVFHDEELSLLLSLASEIGANLLKRRFEEQAAEGEKMRAAGLLAAGIAHNFNNLLQAILGQASLLEMQKDAPPRVEKAARIITEAANKGAGLVKQLSSFSHLEEPRPELSEVNAIINRARDSFMRFLSPQHRLELRLGERLPRAHVDSSQILRIVLTLVSNACEAMPGGGTVEVFTDAFQVDESNPHYEVPYGEYVRIGVRDSGTGMDEETRRRCFEPFFTTKNVDRSTGLSVSGSGLGLAAAYALAKRNGGRLVAESKLGSGSVFIVYLPVTQQAAGEAGAQAAPLGERGETALSGQIEVKRELPTAPEPRAGAKERRARKAENNERPK